MPVDLTIVESTTELGQTVVEVILEGASEPGPAGPGVPTGGTLNQVLTKDSATDFDTSWQDAQGGGGGVTDADFLVGTAHAGLSAEIVVGTAPGGELGGTWASPTVDATHSGSSHAAVQAAAEATAAAALAAHVGAADPHTGYRLESAAIVSADIQDGTIVAGDLAFDPATQAELDAHVNDTSAAHAASAISADSTTLVGVGTDVQAVLEELDNGIADHLADAADAHDASAISVLDTNGDYTATDVEGVLAEIAPQLGGGAGHGTDGWVDDTATTWTYASATTFTVSGDLTAKFSKGTRLKLTQTTVKYFVVVLSAHAAGTTTVTITGGTDYTLANAAITDNYYSYAANPQGYPGWFNFTPTTGGFSSVATNLCRFRVEGNACTIVMNISGTSNATDFTATVPIACGGGATTSFTAPFIVTNNGTVAANPGRAQINSGGDTDISFLRDWTGSLAFTNSGPKAGQHMLLTYEI